MGCLEGGSALVFTCEGFSERPTLPLFYFWKGGDCMEFCPDCGFQLLHVEGCSMCPACGYSACNCGICNGKENLNVQSEDTARTSKKIISA